MVPSTLYLQRKFTCLYIDWLTDWLPSRSQTNADGRCPTLLPAGYKAEKGIYRVTFETKEYFSKQGQECFYPYVQVRVDYGGVNGFDLTLCMI